MRYDRQRAVKPVMRQQAYLEKQLIDAFDRVRHQDYPNPTRAVCPGDAILRRLAFEPDEFNSVSTLDHISHCAPCLDELKRLRARARNTS